MKRVICGRFRYSIPRPVTHNNTVIRCLTRFTARRSYQAFVWFMIKRICSGKGISWMRKATGSYCNSHQFNCNKNRTESAGRVKDNTLPGSQGRYRQGRIGRNKPDADTFNNRCK
jgi:hypothetical protein